MSADLEERLRAAEGKLAALAGFNGVPGQVSRIAEEQLRSATSQGQRLEDLKTWAREKHAEVIEEQRQLRKDVTQTRESAIDTRARLYGMGALIVALIAAAGVLVKLLT